MTVKDIATLVSSSTQPHWRYERHLACKKRLQQFPKVLTCGPGPTRSKSRRCRPVISNHK